MVNNIALWLLLIPITFSVGLFFAIGGAKKYERVYRYGASTKPSPIVFAVISLLIGMTITASTFMFGVGSKTQDYEVLNGQIIGKSKDKVSCRHSYSCNCRQVCSGSGSSSSCSTVCDTCYEHSYDIDWVAHSTLGGIYIDTIDRQGLEEPPRWTKVQPGQPVAMRHQYVNYIKAVPSSILNFSDGNKNKFSGKVPAYPINVYDYHYVDRVLSVGVKIPNLAEWNMALANTLRTLGMDKRVNVVIIPTSITDKDYTYAVRDAWLGGKKNDVVVIVSITEYPKINWVSVLSWSDNELFKVMIRDELQAGDFEVNRTMAVISKNIYRNFKRKSMKDFEYLKDEIYPDEEFIWAGIILNLILVGGMFIFYRKGF